MKISPISSSIFIWIFCSIIWPLRVNAQGGDSLRVAELLGQAKSQMNQNADVGFAYLDTIKTFVEKENHNLYQKADYHKVIGIGLFRKSNYDSSNYHYLRALDIFEAGNYELDMAKIAVNISFNYNRLGKYDETIELATKALRMFEKLEDHKGVGISSNIIGQVYFYNKDYDKAKVYFRKYLMNGIAAGDSTEIAGGYSNLGAACNDLDQFDSAIYYNKQALIIHQNLNNLYGLGNAYQNIGGNFQDRHLYDSAIFYYKKALPYYLETNHKTGLTECYVNLAECYIQTYNDNAAIENANKSLQIAQEIDESFMIQESARILSKAYEVTGNYRKSLENFKLYDSLSTIVFNEETRKNIEEINVQYETEKKENQIALQSAQLAEKEAQNERKVTIIAGLVFGCLLLIVLFVMNRNLLLRKNKLLKQQAQIELREAQIEATISSQEKERSRFAKDLHDGFGQMITVLNLNLKSLEDQNNDRHKIFDASSKILDEMYRELKGICFNLMPQTLVKEGISAALNEFALRINNTGKVTVSTYFFGLEERLTEVQEISLYRISQEWINNALKYSDVIQISLSLTKDDDEIILMIEDDGVGFDVELLKNGKGNGWKNMNARANLIKGDLEVDTNPGIKGNTLIVTTSIVSSREVIKTDTNTMETV
ncbi:tetratricopeptide repeat-containing sensor histidine kinase [Marinoscillum pacificum]|uniref:tetratricopeptide repeat-containing sensor histidine kinase n=1 Tax=Marinoscillum pacificum TaxID=392723 RepID=UPI002158080B|nr:tetratricopeptide repeat-containing sensor histidine kinase [Marinoscillum pacificum]